MLAQHGRLPRGEIKMDAFLIWAYEWDDEYPHSVPCLARWAALQLSGITSTSKSSRARKSGMSDLPNEDRLPQ